MNYKRGKKPARSGAIQMLFGSYFDVSKLPPPPLRFGRPGLIHQWGMLANDRYGCCVWSGGDHESMMLEAAAAAPVATFTGSNALADYAACTGFVASDPNTDQGTDVMEAAKYRQRVGLIDFTGKRHKIDVYTALKAGNLQQLALAVFYLGVAGVGVLLPDNAEDQFDMGEAWDIVPGHPPLPNEGHYIPCVGRNSKGDYLFVSWGRLQAAKPKWVVTCMDEGVAYLSRERLKASGLSPQDLNLAKLNDDFRQLTGTA